MDVMDVMGRLDELGGVARRSELVVTAADRRLLIEGITEGALRDLGGGWVATRATGGPLLAARRFNATITCVSAAPFYGLQRLSNSERVHVAVPRSRGARYNPDRRRLVVHRESGWTRPDDPRLPLAPIVEVLGRVLRCQRVEEALVMVDSALKKNLVTVEQIERTLVGPGSVAARAALERSDPSSRAATETLARLGLRDAGYDVETGVPIEGVGEVDVVVDRLVVVECDGFSYHSGRREFREDRRRDRALVALGYIVLRFTWEDVMHDMPGLVAAVQRALERGSAAPDIRAGNLSATPGPARRA